MSKVHTGKICYVGISNEIPWGDALSAVGGKARIVRIVTVQNPYSLLNRNFAVGMAEISQFEWLELLAYSSMAFGILSDKYLHGAPAGQRAEYAL